MDLTRPRYHRKRWIFVFASGIITALLIVSWVAGRYYITGEHTATLTQNQRTLCQVIRDIVITGDQSLDTITYYQHHPAELARAHDANRVTLPKLNCKQLG